MNLNDLLKGQDIDPQHVIVLRHRPHEPELNKVLPWLAAKRPELFNAYQQTQGERLERAMQKMQGGGFVASFIGHEPGKALFVGLYSIGASKPITYEKFWQVPAFIELKEKFGMVGYTREEARDSALWFDLTLTDFYKDWKGKLIVKWPPPELSWWRRAHLNEMSVVAILEDSALDAAMPKWDEIELTWEELGVIPTPWETKRNGSTRATHTVSTTTKWANKPMQPTGMSEPLIENLRGIGVLFQRLIGSDRGSCARKSLTGAEGS
jgi:hypothetical protein